jgi:hypothetical protein
MNEIEKRNEELFTQFWTGTECPRTVQDLLDGEFKYTFEGIRKLTRAAFLAGRRTMLPIPTEEAEE